MSSSSGRLVCAPRSALTVAVVVVVGGAAVASTVSAGSRPAPRRPQPHRRSGTVAAPAPSFSPYRGEPELPRRSSGPGEARAAAVRFVRDYQAWSAGRLSAIPRSDATARVIGLLERAGRLGGQFAPRDAGSVRIAPAGTGRYVVTSAAGNFLVGRSGSRWLVVSLPGD